MRAPKLIGDQHRGSFAVSSEQEVFDGYEQRLIRWGCAECKFFEKRVFSSGVISEELDAYIICRFGGELIDLIGEATACPKDSRPQLHRNKSKSGRARLHCVYRA
jgi:hypothetical protein